MLSDQHTVRFALNLLLNLEELGLFHHMVIASSADVCSELQARAEQTTTGTTIGCGYSTFLHRGWSARVDAGLDAYAIGNDHVYHLWWQRWFVLSEAVGLGYRVLSLDTDISLRANPYPLLHGAFSHHSLITGLDNDRDKSAYVFPNTNVGFVYVRGPARSAAHWILSETRRRFERLLRGEVFPLPSQIGSSQQMVWEQDTFKDVLETAAFTPAAPSYRRAQIHCAKRTTGDSVIHARIPRLPTSWQLQIEQIRFFAPRRSRERMPKRLPSAWLPLHLPQSAHAAFGFGASTPAGPMASRGCNGSDDGSDAAGGATFNIWEGANATARRGGASASGSYGALPMWFFASYLLCPFGAACDGRWAKQPSPILAGHLMGAVAKFWLLRLFGWWHYEAGRRRSLSTAPAVGDAERRTRQGGAPAALLSSRVASHPPYPPSEAPSVYHGNHSALLPPVYPPSDVRPLVLRGHQLTLGTNESSLRQLRAQLVRWTLLALALGRRAVLPLVRCHNPVPTVPPDLTLFTEVVKLLDGAACDARANAAGWRLAPSVPTLVSHEQMTLTTEMRRIIRYGGARMPAGASCCQVIPELNCVDRHGDRGEQTDELMLCERDLTWLEAEQAEHVLHPRPPRVVRVAHTRAPLGLDALQALAEERTLVIDVGEYSPPLDPLAYLPPPAAVEAAVRAKVRGGHFPSNRGRWQVASGRCVGRLLKAASASQAQR